MSDNLQGSDELDSELEEPTAEVDETAAEEDSSEELESIELDGEEVTLADIRAWKAGHMMQADYTRKTMDLSNQRKVVEGLSESLNSKIADLTDKIQVLEGSLDDGYTDAELDEMFETDPGQYRKIERARQKKRDAIDNAKASREKARSDLIPAEQQALFSAMPEWGDKEKGQKTYETDIKLAQAFMGKLGYSAEEVQGIVDHRVMKAIILAARYNNLKDSKPEAKRVKTKTKPSKPGNSGSTVQPKTLGQLLYG